MVRIWESRFWIDEKGNEMKYQWRITHLPCLLKSSDGCVSDGDKKMSLLLVRLHVKMVRKQTIDGGRQWIVISLFESALRIFWRTSTEDCFAHAKCVCTRKSCCRPLFLLLNTLFSSSIRKQSIVFAAIWWHGCYIKWLFYSFYFWSLSCYSCVHRFPRASTLFLILYYYIFHITFGI